MAMAHVLMWLNSTFEKVTETSMGYLIEIFSFQAIATAGSDKLRFYHTAELSLIYHTCPLFLALY